MRCGLRPGECERSNNCQACRFVQVSVLISTGITRTEMRDSRVDVPTAESGRRAGDFPSMVACGPSGVQLVSSSMRPSDGVQTATVRRTGTGRLRPAARSPSPVTSSSSKTNISSPIGNRDD